MILAGETHRGDAMRAWLGLAAVGTAFVGGIDGAQAAPPLEAYGRLPAVELVRLSPDGDRFAWVAAAGEERKLLVGSGGKILIQAPIGQTKVRDLEWVGEDYLLVVTSSTIDLRLDFGFKYEISTVLNVDVTTGKGAFIFKDRQDIAPIAVGLYGSGADQGKSYAYFGGVTYRTSAEGAHIFDHGWPDLYRVDLGTGQPSLIQHGSPQVGDWVTAPDGTIVAHEQYDWRSGLWQLVTGADIGKILVERKAPTGSIGLDGLGQAPDQVVVVDNTGDQSIAEEVSVKDGSATQLFHDLSVEEFLHDPSTHLLIGAVTLDAPGAVFLDPKLQTHFDAVRRAFPGLQLRLESFSRDLGRIIVETDGTGDPGTYWLVDMTTHHADPIGDVHPAIKPEDVGPVSVVEYKARDGLQMDGVLTLPPGKPAKDLPLVVMPHGGPIGISDEPRFDYWAQAFASRGYAVFQPNYRGSFGRGLTFQNAGYGEWGGKMLTDIADGVAALAAKGVIDPKRACIVGASYGGYAALAGVTIQHGLYRCAVSVSGPADMTTFFQWETQKHGKLGSTTRYWRLATGMDKQGSGVLRTISPTTYVGSVEAPVLLIHGKDDTVVPIDQSYEMLTALKRAGKSVELVEINGGDHWETREDARMATVVGSVNFVLKHNPPD